MNRTKIDWCDYVWNPVWGCLTQCKYCYARKLARRFWKQMYIKELKFQKVLENEPVRKCLSEFKPVFLQSNFNKKFPEKPSRIFVNSMSDIYWWKEKWMKVVLKKIREYPRHAFLFLTKFPKVYEWYKFPENCWLGYTSEGDSFYPEWTKVFKNNIKFVSIEPLIRELDTRELGLIVHTLDWIILGFQTNPYRPAPRKEVEYLINFCKRWKIALFIKDNVYRAYSDLPVIKQFPENKRWK